MGRLPLIRRGKLAGFVSKGFQQVVMPAGMFCFEQVGVQTLRMPLQESGDCFRMREF